METIRLGDSTKISLLELGWLETAIVIWQEEYGHSKETPFEVALEDLRKKIQIELEYATNNGCDKGEK